MLPGQNSGHFADGIFKRMLLNGNHYSLIEVPLNFVTHYLFVNKCDAYAFVNTATIGSVLYGAKALAEPNTDLWSLARNFREMWIETNGWNHLCVVVRALDSVSVSVFEIPSSQKFSVQSLFFSTEVISSINWVYQGWPLEPDTFSIYDRTRS